MSIPIDYITVWEEGVFSTPKEKCSHQCRIFFQEGAMSLSKRHTTIVCSILIAIATCGLTPKSNAELLHESATMGAINQWLGYQIDEYTFFGSRFEVKETIEVTAIGGHLASINDRNIFGAIVTLNDRYDFPSGSPFWSLEVEGYTYFVPPAWSKDVRVPLNVILQPGWYGLVFGAGEFNFTRTAIASMPSSGQTSYPGSSYFAWDGLWGMWFDASFQDGDPRFVVESNPPKPPTEIHGTKFEDANGNGKWDTGEQAITGWEFYLDINQNGSHDLGEPNCIADPNGCYEFVDLEPGTYKVGEVMKDGWIQTMPGGDGFYTITVDANDIETGLDFGNARPQPGDISGMKFHDLNANGIKEAGEPPLAGFEIYLDLNNNGGWDSGEPKIQTASNGSYKFTNVQPGDYVVAEVSKTGWAQTFPGTTGGKIYACEYMDSANRTNINTIDPATGEVINTFSVPQRLIAMKGGDIAVGPVSIFFVNDIYTDEMNFQTVIWELDPQTGAVIDYDEIDTPPDHLTFGAAYLNGKVYFSATTYPFPEPPVSYLTCWNPVTDEIENVLILDMHIRDDLAAIHDEGVLLWSWGQLGLEGEAKMDPATGEILGVIQHDLLPCPFFGYLDGYIYRTRWNKPFTTYMIDASTGQIVNTFDITGLNDMDGTGADGIPAEKYNVTVMGADITGLDFGNVRTQTGKLSGKVFGDTNNNGRRDEGEPAIADREIYHDSNNNGQWDSGEEIAITDATGTYVFNDLSGGVYKLRQKTPCNWTHTSPNDMKAEFLDITDPSDVVFDELRNMLYIGTRDGKLFRYDLATQTFLAPLTVGTELNGMDITPDGDYLYITEGDPVGSTGIIHKVNLNNATVQDIQYALQSSETGGWDIKIGAFGKAFLTSTYIGYSLQPLRQIDLGTDIVTIRTGIPESDGDGINSRTRIFRSDDRSFFCLVGAYSNSYIITYNATTDQFISNYTRNEYIRDAAFDCGKDGSIIAYCNERGSTWTYSHDLEPIMPFAGGIGGLVEFDQDRNILYYDYQGTVMAMNIQTMELIHHHGIGELRESEAFVTGQSTQTDDGRLIALTYTTDPDYYEIKQGVHLIEIEQGYEIGLTEGRDIGGFDFGTTADMTGDFNKDKKVDKSDFAELADGWKTNNQCLEIAPTGTDGTVDLNDLLAFAQNWLTSSAQPYVIDEDFESGDFSVYPWVQGDLPWTITQDTPFQGQYCAISAEMPRYGHSTMEITLNVKAGNITFLATQDQADAMLYFSIDGDTWLYSDGELNSDWGFYSFAVSEGEHTFTWEYYPRTYNTHATIDAISFPPLAE